MINTFKYLAMAGLLSFFAKSSLAQELKVGSMVPEFKLQDQSGNEFDSKDVVGKKKLVIYFYPKDETPGCTKEACYFRDKYEVFQKADAMVIGISGQSVDSHKEFAENHKLPFTLLSDKDNAIRKLFGVRTSPIPGRVTFVVDKSGKVAYVFDSLTQPTKHVDEAMRILEGMK
ncbi:MAG TPA: peroxiredoxin [Bacteroidales bacterium]